jgi:hypothetical protein
LNVVLLSNPCNTYQNQQRKLYKRNA